MKQVWKKASRNAALGLVGVALALGPPIVSAVASQPTTPLEDSPAPPAPTNAEEKPAQQPSARNMQEPTPPAGSEIPKIRTTTNEVNVVFTVTDKHGRHVTDLKQGDFRVVDDKKPVEEVRSFHNETNLPLQVGLLIDASNSVRDRFKFEQQAAIEFLNQTVRPHYDLAAVIGFDDTPDVTQDFTHNTEALARGRRELRQGGW